MVRVYVYNLRKKLDAYYRHEGEKDEKRIRIPKGGYAIAPTPRKKEPVHTSVSIGKKWGVSLGIALIASFLLNLYLASLEPNRPMVANNGLWADLIASELPKMLILGDLFIYNEHDTAIQLTRSIRDPSINSLEEFEAFRSSHTKTNTEIGPLSYTHLILGSAQWIKKLSEIFYSLNSNYTIRTMSRFNLKQLQDYDLMVVGMQKTLGVFKDFYGNSAIEYDAENDAFLYTEKEDGEVVFYKPSGDADSYHTDYGLMAKVPGPNNNTIYIFSGLWDTGATQSLKNFTDAALLSRTESQMRAEFGTLPKYYEVFFEVNGIDRMELSSKILHINKLEGPAKP